MENITDIDIAIEDLPAIELTWEKLKVEEVAMRLNVDALQHIVTVGV